MGDAVNRARNDTERLRVEGEYHLDFETYDRPAKDAPHQMVSLTRQAGGFYVIRVADGLSFKYIPRQPYYAFNKDPFALLDERYWPLVMDFVMECEP